MAERTRRTVLSYFFVLIAVVSLSAFAVLGLTLYRYEVESRDRADIEEHHVRSLTLATEVASRIGIAREIAATDGALPGAAGREFTSSILAISEGIATIRKLQEDLGEEPFAGVVDRASSRAEAMRAAALDGSWTAARWEAELTAIDFTTFQLSRLHSVIVEEELAATADRSERLRVITLIVTPTLLAGTAALVVRLVRLVRRRLRELDDANAALVETRDRLQQRERLDALGTLVGGVAHDFNNLLTTILGYTELALLDVDRNGPAYAQLRTIQSTGERAAGLTRQLLAFSRRQPSRSEPTDVNLLVRDLEPVVRGLVRDDIELEITYGPSLPPVMVDPVQMEQVLLNLVVNARDAMPDGGRLTLRTDHLARAQDHAGEAFTRIRIADDGDGMAPEVSARVFEPFFTTKDAGSGTGLGMSVVHGIVTESGGFIDIESAPGAGTTIDVLLPAIGALETGSPATEPAHSGGGTETILLVDDQPQIRNLLSRTFTDLGYRVLTAEDAEHAFEVFGREGDAIDIAVTDVVMPGMRGPDLIAELRRSRPDLPAVYVSGYGAEAALEAVRESGDPFVAKPFKLRELTGTVRDQLDRAHSPTRPPASTR